MSRMTCTITISSLLVAVGACSSRHGPVQSDPALGIIAGQQDDEIVTLADCPPEVQETIRSHLDGGTIQEIERTTDHGEVLYEVDVATGDGVIEFDVAADGAFRGYEEGDDDDGEEDDDDEDEDETEVALDDVPDVVKDAALAAVSGIVLKEAVIETEDGQEIYELEGELDGVAYEIEVTPAGEVLEVEQENDDDEDDDD